MSHGTPPGAAVNTDHVDTPDLGASTPPAIPAQTTLATSDTPEARPQSASREGHRPLLTAAQALLLAQRLYGIHVRADSGTQGTDLYNGNAASSTISAAICVELPSYDDRNFHISASQRLQRPQSGPRGQEPCPREPQRAPYDQLAVPRHPHSQLEPHLKLQQSEDYPQQHPESQDAEGPPQGVRHPLTVVLKVHNTQDNNRTLQLQAIDQAMLRLQAADVLTNTPLRPMGHHLHHPSVSGCSNAADGLPWSSSSNSSWGSGGEVPYRVMTAPAQEQFWEAEVAEATPFCWAYLPCTCHTTCRVAAEPAQGDVTDDSPARSPEGGMADVAAKDEAEEREGARATVEGPAAGEQFPRSAGFGQEAPRPGCCHWHIVRCLTFVPGRVLSSVPYLTPALLVSLGRMMGRVTSGLAGWEPPSLRRCSHDWYPENGGVVLSRLVPGIQAFDSEQRSLLLRVADELLAAGPRLADPRVLPRQVCHADANDDNCVISDDCGEVVGLIDFGDMAIMPRVCEVAITMLYAMLLGLNRPMEPTVAATARHLATSAKSSASTAKDDRTATAAAAAEDDKTSERTALKQLLGIAGLVLCGYQHIVPLFPEELAVIPMLLRGRLAQSLALGAASVVSDPGNAAYLLATQRPGWRVIRLLTPGSAMTDEEMLQCMLLDGRPQSG